MSQSFVINAREYGLASGVWRDMYYTGRLQIGWMTVQPGQKIDTEVHQGLDQSLFVLAGRGEAELDGETTAVGTNDLIVVKEGTAHEVRNTGVEPLVLLIHYGPPDTPPAAFYARKEDELEDKRAK